MSSAKFVSNLDGMNEGENFSKDLLKVILSLIPPPRPPPKKKSQLHLLISFHVRRVSTTPSRVSRCSGLCESHAAARPSFSVRARGHT